MVKKGFALRITAMMDNANVACLLFNAQEQLERYNMPDTLKAQYTAFLSKGRVCYSDMGHILMSIVEDSCGWHDTLSGVSDNNLLKTQFGEGNYQHLRNDFYRSGKDLFLVELGKWGLGKRDIVPNINFFSKVSVDDDGNMQYQQGHSKAGDYIDLRAEMDVLVVLNTAMHPLDNSRHYAPKEVTLSLWRCDPVADDDICLNSRPENQRGFANNAIYHCQCH